MKTYIKIYKKGINFDDTETGKYNIHQYKRPNLIDNIDANKILVSNKIYFGNDFKYFIDYKNAKKLHFYVFSFQKWVAIEVILIKLNVFFNKRWKIVRKI